MTNKKKPKPPIVIFESRIRNDVTITKSKVIVTVATDEDLDTCLDAVNKLMEKHGKEK